MQKDNKNSYANSIVLVREFQGKGAESIHGIVIVLDTR